MRLLSFESAAGASFGAVKGDGVVDLGRRLGGREQTSRNWQENSVGTVDLAEVESGDFFRSPGTPSTSGSRGSGWSAPDGTSP